LSASSESHLRPGVDDRQPTPRAGASDGADRVRCLRPGRLLSPGHHTAARDQPARPVPALPGQKALFLAVVRRYFQQMTQAFAAAAAGRAGEDALQATRTRSRPWVPPSRSCVSSGRCRCCRCTPTPPAPTPRSRPPPGPRSGT